MTIGTGIALLGPWAFACVLAMYEDDGFWPAMAWVSAALFTLAAFKSF